MTDLDPQIQQMIDLRVELRALTAEVHAAIKDLTPLLREYKQIKASGKKEIFAEMETAVNAELAKYQKHMQDEMNAQPPARRKRI